jgi:hypothetical protein
MNCLRVVKLGALMCGLVVSTGSSQAGFVNGRFSSGDLSGWTAYSLDGGTIGTPAAVAAGVFGTEAGHAARLQVGDATLLVGPAQGGGLAQTLTLKGGTYHFSVDLASQRPIAVANMDGGKFELLVDGVVMAGHDFGYLAANATERQHLEADLDLSAGEHEFQLQWTRTYRGDNQTPFQFMDNVFLSDDPVSLGGGGGSLGPSGPTVGNPVPGSAVLFGIGLATLGVGRLVRRRRLAV